MQIGWLEQLETFQWNINKNPQVCCAIKSVKWRHQGGLSWNGSPPLSVIWELQKNPLFYIHPPSHCLLEQEVRNPNAVHIFVTLRLSGHLLRRQISQADKTQMAPLSGRPARTRQWKTIQIRDKWKHPDYALNHQQPDWLADGGWTGCLIKWLELQTPKQGHQLFHHRWAGYRPNVVSAWEPHQETQTAWASWKKNNFLCKNTKYPGISIVHHHSYHPPPKSSVRKGTPHPWGSKLIYTHNSISINILRNLFVFPFTSYSLKQQKTRKTQKEQWEASQSQRQKIDNNEHLMTRSIRGEGKNIWWEYFSCLSN